jgi:hypothetical protein
MEIMQRACLIFVVLLRLAAPSLVQGQFTYTTNNGAITLTGYSGAEGAVGISNFVTSIGVSPFVHNLSLTSVTIPVSVTNIGLSAFYGCENLRTIIFAGSAPTVGSRTFDSSLNLNTPLKALALYLPGEPGWTNAIGGLPTAMLDTQSQFGYTTNNSSVTIADYVGPGGEVSVPVTIDDLPVVNIQGGAFLDCTSLTNINIPSGVTNIESDAFIGCTNLASVSIPNGVISIGDHAFYGCASLTNATIGTGVTGIATFAFANCYNLARAYFMGNAPPVVPNIFLGDSQLTVYYLPGTTGWGATFPGSGPDIQSVLWNPAIQTGDGSFGFSNNQFGFNITGTPNIPIAVQVCNDLSNPVWSSLQTLSLTNGLVYFSDTTQTSGMGRYYKISSP